MTTIIDTIVTIFNYSHPPCNASFKVGIRLALIIADTLWTII